MLYELIAATFFGMAIWIPIYKYYISRLVGDHVVARVENKEIDRLKKLHRKIKESKKRDRIKAILILADGHKVAFVARI